MTLFPDQYEHLGLIPEDVQLYPVTCNETFLNAIPGPVDLAILDIHETTPEFISKVRASAHYIAGFEDLGRGRNHLDCLIDCNLAPESSKDVPGSVKTLFGRDYSLLAPEYEAASRTNRDFSNGIRSVLITMGGTDPNNLTGSVATPLLKKFPDLKITVTSGPGFATVDLLMDVIQNPRVTHVFQPKSLAPLLLQNDAVICSGGVTLQEALTAGTPSFVVPQVDHQEKLAFSLEEKGAAQRIGQPGKVDIGKLINAVRTSPETLTAMSTTGRKIFDGRGLQRIVHFLSNLPSK